MDLSFYQNKRVLITGHTGFKGSWMCAVLQKAGAKVTGYAIAPPTSPSLFSLCKIAEGMDSIEGDVRNLKHLAEVFKQVKPEIVIHMAAQPIVRESYRNPVYTYDVNVMGTVNVLECIRQTKSVKSFVNVTTDKVYKNKEWEWGYRENEELNGFDPYSNSKSCSELVTDSFRHSFFDFADAPAITTARAGNVIGGGDFAADRIVPDCIRAASENREIIIRNPYSVRPFQHVLEPVCAYLLLAQKQWEDKTLAGSYNVGPYESDCYTAGEIATMFCDSWKKISGKEINWINKHDGGPHEASFLKLDCSKIRRHIGWEPVWNLNITMEKIVEWTWCYMQGGDYIECMKKQIEEYLGEMK